jgi:hypothetical protein
MLVDLGEAPDGDRESGRGAEALARRTAKPRPSKAPTRHCDDCGDDRERQYERTDHARPGA